MISPALTAFLYLLTVGYAVTGAILYVAPAWASANFAWRISPFVAMTLGGWCLGNAWLAFTIARRGNWPAVLSPLLYLALFGVFEAAVIVAFRERVLLTSPLAWIYLVTIAATALFAVAALVDGWRRRPVVATVGARTGAVSFALTLAFIAAVGFLGLYGLLAVEGMRGLNAGIFPEVITPLSLRAFGSFYLALAMAVIPILWTRGLGNILNHGYTSYGLLVFITVAAIVYIGQFDFVARPTQAIYIGIYVLVGAVIGIYLLRYGSGAEPRGSSTTAR
jgi:hypothetical protein